MRRFPIYVEVVRIILYNGHYTLYNINQLMYRIWSNKFLLIYMLFKM